jgi:hypothetical protein
MVALHNRKLTPRDIWPNNIWNSEDRRRVEDEIEAQMRADGVPQRMWVFEFSARMQAHAKQFSPGWLGRQQKIMREIYPPAPPAPPLNRLELTDEELEYLINRLQGANDEVGQGILAKLRRS